MTQDMVPNASRLARKPGVSAGQRPGLRSLADVVETLFAEFGSTLALPTVLAAVRRCRRELDIGGQHRPEVLEQLARRRLQALVRAGTASGASSPRSQAPFADSPATSHPPPVFPLQRHQHRRPAG